MRNVLTNVLGAREETEVHVQELKLEPGALVLISSDGLHGVLKPDVICGLMSSGDELEVMARKLIDVALDAGSRDNVTVILMKYDG
jgi:serine/threonine protein phosphatase PrpC